MSTAAASAKSLRPADQSAWIKAHSPELVTAGVLFLIYSNAMAVAVRFHGVPGIAAKAFPAVLIAPLFYHVVIRNRGVAIGSALPWVIAYAAVQIISTINSAQPLIAMEHVIEFLIEGLILYLMFTNLVRTETGLRFCVVSLVLAGCLMGAIPLFQQLTGKFESNFGGFGQKDGDGDEEAMARMEANEERGEEISHRLAGSIGEKNRYAQVMLMVIPLGLLVWKSATNRPMAMLGIAATVLAAAGATLAFSRATTVAIGLVLMLAGFLRIVDRRQIVLLGVVGIGGMLLIPSYRDRIASLANLKDLVTGGRHSSADGALKGRATEMGGAALVFLDYPLTGVGPGLFKYHAREYGQRIGLRSLKGARRAHCLPLDVAAETGLPGLICVSMVFAICFRNLYRVRQLQGASAFVRHAGTGFFFVIAFYLTTGFFLHFAFIRYFWIMIALSECVSLIAHRQQLNHHTRPSAAIS